MLFSAATVSLVITCLGSALQEVRVEFAIALMAYVG
jgi:hypothetical protein